MREPLNEGSEDFVQFNTEEVIGLRQSQAFRKLKEIKIRKGKPISQIFEPAS
jgi:hypothetical protein